MRTLNSIILSKTFTALCRKWRPNAIPRTAQTVGQVRDSNSLDELFLETTAVGSSTGGADGLLSGCDQRYAIGLPPNKEVFSPSKRPFKVADKGRPVVELFASSTSAPTYSIAGCTPATLRELSLPGKRSLSRVNSRGRYRISYSDSNSSSA